MNSCCFSEALPVVVLYQERHFFLPSLFSWFPASGMKSASLLNHIKMFSCVRSGKRHLGMTFSTSNCLEETELSLLKSFIGKHIPQFYQFIPGPLVRRVFMIWRNVKYNQENVSVSITLLLFHSRVAQVY